MRDKIITAVCRTVEGIEWTSLKVGKDGKEQLEQKMIQLDFSDDIAEELTASAELPESFAEQIQGDVMVPLRTAELLMRVVDLPSTQDDEIADMALLQIDKISPFPSDQVAISHEVLKRFDDSSLVLLAAAKHECIDTIGDLFEEKGVRIHSIDSRLMGWMQLLKDARHLENAGCEVLIIDDGIDFSLITTTDGIPLAFRMLHTQTDNENFAEEIAYEIEYTLSTLDAERDLPIPTTLQFWGLTDLASSLRAELTEKTGLQIQHHALAELPPLSEGIVRRALTGHRRIELIPREWVEYKQREHLRRKMFIAIGVVSSIWLALLLIFFTIYKVRDFKLSSTQKRAQDIAPAAIRALENREKLTALKAYTDRSDSALECLLEITQLLPIGGSIEFVSFKYDKSKGITIRGTADNDGQVDDYFVALAKAPLFDRIKDQSISTTTRKGVRQTVFSLTLTLPSKEDEK